MKFKIIVDIDGVVANFNQPYIGELNAVSGLGVKYDINQLTEWNYEKKLGFTDAHIDAVWEKLVDPIRGREFWAGLQPTCSNKEFYTLEDWNDNHDLTFISSAPDVHRQTRQKWVHAFYNCDSPVLMSNRKGDLAYGLKAHAIIDDKPSNLEQVLRKCGMDCMTYLYDRPWNRGVQHPRIIRVGSLDEAFDRLRESAVL